MESRYNTVDAMFLKLFSRKLKILRGTGGDDVTKARTKALESFVLGMSNQQLVTGYALTIAIVCILGGAGDLGKHRSAASVQVAASLAAFSVTTHLSVLSFLPQHFNRRRRLRYTRFGAITILLGLVLAIQTIVLSEPFVFDNTMSVQCAMDQGYYANDFILIAYGIVTVYVLLLFGFFRKFLQAFHSRYRISKRLFYSRLYGTRRQEGDISLEDFLLLQRTYLADSLYSGQNPRKILDTRTFLIIVYEELTQSFIWELMSILFYFSWALLWFIRLFVTEIPSANSFLVFQPTFGQLLPLIFLALPIIVAWESWSGKSHATSVK